MKYDLFVLIDSDKIFTIGTNHAFGLQLVVFLKRLIAIILPFLAGSKIFPSVVQDISVSVISHHAFGNFPDNYSVHENLNTLPISANPTRYVPFWTRQIPPPLHQEFVIVIIHDCKFLASVDWNGFHSEKFSERDWESEPNYSLSQ